MTKQNTVDSKVLAILRECPETRYDDMQLILCYYNRYSYFRVGDMTLENIVNNYKGYGLPCFETIRRARQRVQSLFPELSRRNNDCCNKTINIRNDKIFLALFIKVLLKKANFIYNKYNI